MLLELHGITLWDRSSSLRGLTLIGFNLLVEYLQSGKGHLTIGRHDRQMVGHGDGCWYGWH